jgi:aarF domain-containing kinase
MVALLARALVLAAVADALVAPTRPRRSRVARAAGGDGPLLSVPIPGSASATLQVPGFAAQRALLEALVEESRDVPPLAALRRSAALNAAVAKTAAKVLRDPAAASAPRATRELFEELGATFVKLGQLVASSPTLFPEAWTTEFEKTLDGAPPIPYATVKRVVEASLGTKIAAAFSTFDEAPLATASVAQVHAATLRNGDRVVVKVLKPGVRDTLTADLVFLNGAAKILEAVAPETKRVSLADVAAQLRDSTLQELDLREEARRLRSFRGFLASSGLEQAATCPLPYEDLSSKEVLTMTRLDGSRLVDADASDPASEAAVATVIRTWARSVVEHDFFHADVHGGNVLLLRNGTVGIIDFGIVGTLPPAVYGAVVDLAVAFNARPRDYGGIADALRGMGVVDGAKFDREKFAGDLRRAFDAVEANDAAAIVGDVIAVSEDNNLVLPREFGLLTKQAVYLNRYVTTLAPDLDVFEGDLLGAGGAVAGAPAPAAPAAPE